MINEYGLLILIEYSTFIILTIYNILKLKSRIFSSKVSSIKVFLNITEAFSIKDYYLTRSIFLTEVNFEPFIPDTFIL